MFNEFISLKKDGLYYVVQANYEQSEPSYIHLLTKDGKHKVSHENEKFIKFLISDLQRLGFPEVGDDGLLSEKNIPFSAFYIYNNQKVLNRDMLLDKFLPIALLNEKTLIQTFNGPPLEMHQLDRLIPVRDAIEDSFGKETFKNISNYAWGTFYKSMLSFEDHGPEDVFFDYKAKKEISSEEDIIENNWNGPGTEITEEEFKNTEEFNKIYSEFNALSDEELASIFSLFFWHEKLSILCPYLLITDQIDKSVFIEGMLGVNHEVLDGLFMLKKKTDVNKHLASAYSFYNDDVSIAIEYIEKAGVQEDLEYKRFISRLILNHENKTTELKTSFFRCQKSKNKDILVMHEAIKAIAGFQNSSGGHLILGVDDEGNIKGIQNVDEFRNEDDYCRNIELHIGKCLGQTSLSRVLIKFIDIDKNTICHIEVQPCLETYCEDRAYNKKTKKSEDDAIFYLRQNKMTKSLNPKETSQYLRKVNK
tara:strand:- start:422 stop:1852 length:1431 start_codon:yes stop_codon:yes gene_type:complete